ncbi:hypothetical protein GCM10023350_22960 [Nocardioides endophyticus]|uniref:Uncharacterized protein n=1 Tax=Nocardioides endophyticus TaxID=1353775 RepID=A0ABP8YVT2_9ACTN
MTERSKADMYTKYMLSRCGARSAPWDAQFGTGVAPWVGLAATAAVGQHSLHDHTVEAGMLSLAPISIGPAVFPPQVNDLALYLLGGLVRVVVRD